MSQLLAHFGLARPPFARATPRAGVLQHRGFQEAVRRLRFTVDLDSIAALVADAGMGKSLALGIVADDLQADGWTVHYLAHSTTGPFGLVNVLARKVGITPRRSRAETAHHIVSTLLDDERRHLLVIDEAHKLPDATLDDLRLLTITDFDRRSPFVLLLAGQTTLDERLAEPIHYALDQRITTIARLLPLASGEVREYLTRRLTAAGVDRPVFEDGAIDAIADSSAGVPRRINNLATGAMIVAAARDRRLVTAQDAHDAHLDRGRP